ncbi:MAG: sulfotransferase [Planctomycetota bacterium]
MSDFRLLMLSAMYENGGNTTHRFLDGHPQLFVYPFESQLGTRHVQDHWSSTFPLKYRWPEFLAGATPREDFQAMIDEETKVRARTPQVSKFRHAPFELDDEGRAARFAELCEGRPQTRARNVEAFYRATFDAWRDRRASGREQVVVGYSPVVVVDGAKLLADLPAAHLVHVVRNPWSAYADTKRRPVPLGLARYLQLWCLNQYFALTLARRHPERVHLLRLEDLLADPQATLGRLLAKLGLEGDPALARPSFNGEELPEVYPWGTLRRVSPGDNRATAQELSAEERQAVGEWAWQLLEPLGYADFWA